MCVTELGVLGLGALCAHTCVSAHAEERPRPAPPGEESSSEVQTLVLLDDGFCFQFHGDSGV